MFSRWYVESLGDIQELEANGVETLERRLAANPDDIQARLKLMAYHQRGDRRGRPEDRGKRIQHALWLIEHHPDSELLHSPVSRFAPGELSEADERRAIALWKSATQAQPANATILWNAASFFNGRNPDLYLQYLEAAAAADPNHPFALRPLAYLYANSILEGGRSAAHSMAALEASGNAWVLGNAANFLQNHYNRLLQNGTPNPRLAELAERYFRRAQTLDPKSDRKAILPQIDLQDLARAEKLRERARREHEAWASEAVGKIRRLPAAAFPDLPPRISEVLRSRNCTVPQPSPVGAPRNVIHGEFFVKGQRAWAVLCSTNNSSSLLVFRGDRDMNPHTIVTREDLGYLLRLENGGVGYSREITAVNREFMIGHYRAYGGAEPPPIHHQGIDDAFLEKASITWYFHAGKWRQLQGAD